MLSESGEGGAGASMGAPIRSATAPSPQERARGEPRPGARCRLALLGPMRPLLVVVRWAFADAELSLERPARCDWLDQEGGEAEEVGGSLVLPREEVGAAAKSVFAPCVLTCRSAPVSAAALSPDTTLLAVGYEDMRIQVWRIME